MLPLTLTPRPDSHSSYHCQTCHRPFKRLDLLQRHEKRAICGEDGYVRKRPRSESSEDSALAMVHSNLTPTQAMQPSSLDHPYIEVTGPEPIVNHINSNSLATTNPNAETSLNLNLGSNPGANANVNPGVNPNIHSIPAPAPAPVVAATNAPNAPFVVDNSALWGFGQWPLESWEEMWNDVLAPPFGEPAQALNLPFNISTPRMQESAERGGEVSLANAALVVKLQRAFPVSTVRSSTCFGSVQIRRSTLTPEQLLDINLEFIRTSLHHYWSDVAPTFPFIHRGTFDLDAAPPELVMMMVIVGSVHSSHPPSGSPRRDFRITVQEIRGQLVQHCGLDMPISTLQAFCLCHVHDTWYGSRESQFVAQCMWPIMSAHSRKKGIGVAGRPEHDAQEEEAWAAWAKDEGGPRIAHRSHQVVQVILRIATDTVTRTTSRGLLRPSRRHPTLGVLEPTLIPPTLDFCTQPQPPVSPESMGRAHRFRMDPRPRTARSFAHHRQEAAPRLHAGPTPRVPSYSDKRGILVGHRVCPGVPAARTAQD
jgi:hypothetical protein